MTTPPSGVGEHWLAIPRIRPGAIALHPWPPPTAVLPPGRGRPARRPAARARRPGPDARRAPDWRRGPGRRSREAARSEPQRETPSGRSPLDGGGRPGPDARNVTCLPTPPVGRGRPGPEPRHLPEAGDAERRDPRGPRRHPREGLWHLAVLHVAAVRRAGPPDRPRPCLAGIRARGPDRDRRRQPPGALLGHARHPGPRRGAGASLPGFDREGDAVHRRPRRGALRSGRGSGAGGQAPEGTRPMPPPRGHRVRRSPRPPPLPGPGPHEPGRPQGARAPLRRRAPRLFRPGGRQGPGRRPRRHLLHLRHHRSAQGGHAVPLEPDRHRPERHRPRGVAGDGGGARLPAHGVGRRSHVLLRPVHRRRVQPRTARRVPAPSSRTCARSAPPTSSPRRASGRTSSPRS